MSRYLMKENYYRITLLKKTVIRTDIRTDLFLNLTFEKGSIFKGQYELHTYDEESVCFYTDQYGYLYFPVEDVRVRKIPWPKEIVT